MAMSVAMAPTPIPHPEIDPTSRGDQTRNSASSSGSNGVSGATP
jgi:hypothetical protein